MLGEDERKRRVNGVLSAASRLADPGDPLGREARARLPAVTGLSPQGVQLGLVRHVETAVSDGEMKLLLSRAGTAPHVHVVLSANVFVGAVRALAIAVAAAPRVSVRSSRREAVMADLLVRALAEGEGPSAGVDVVGAVDPKPGDAVHVYGRRESIDAVARAAPAGVRVRGHGPGFGIAILDSDGGAAERLSWDVVPFDQRGCLSPRIVIFCGPSGPAKAFCMRLAAELGAREADVPRGRLDEEEIASATLYRETMRAAGYHIDGDSFAIGFDPSPRQLLLPPTGRHVHVACAGSPGDVTALLEPFRSGITAIGALGRGPAVQAAIALAPRARSPALGQMQRPPLDGPIDLRDVE